MPRILVTGATGKVGQACIGRLLADPALDCLITPAIDFHDLPARLPKIFTEPRDVLCQLIRYPEAPM